MPKVKIELPLRRVLDEQGQPVKCPKDNYTFHQIKGAGTLPPGYSRRHLELQCGRCRTTFFEFLAN